MIKQVTALPLLLGATLATVGLGLVGMLTLGGFITWLIFFVLYLTAKPDGVKK
jgi:hypothetical protein